MVEIVGTGEILMAVSVYPGADGTEVHSLTIRGPGGGMGITGSVAVLGDRLWIRHNGEVGATTVDVNGPTEFVLRNSLVEDNTSVGLALAGGQMTVESTVVTRTHPNAPATHAYGVLAAPQSGEMPRLALRRSIVSRSREAGVFVHATDVTIEDSVVSDTQATAPELHADGVVVLADGVTGLPSSLQMRSSVITRNPYQGLYVGGGAAVVENSCVRDSAGGSAGQPGIGVQSQTGLNITAQVTLRSCLVDNNQQVGASAVSSELVLEGTVVRATQPSPEGHSGWGVGGQIGPETGLAANVSVVGSVVEANYHVGVGAAGTVASVDSTIVRATLANTLEPVGRGVQLQPDVATNAPATLWLSNSVVETAAGQAVGVFGSAATIETSLLWQIANDLHGSSGDGVIVAAINGMVPSLHTVATHIADSPRAAVASFGGQVAIGWSALTCNALDLNGEVHSGLDFAFDDLGQNACGCPTARDDCAVVSTSLAPPPPVGGLE